MYLSHLCRSWPSLHRNATQFTRSLTGSASSLSSGQKPRQAPRVMDLDGISLETTVNTGDKTQGYVPNMKDLGQETSHIDKLLSVRLQRRLMPSGGPKSSPSDRRNTNNRQVQRPQQRIEGFAPPRSPRPRTGPATRNAGGNAKPGGFTRPRRAPRAQGGASGFRGADAEPEVPVTTVPIPARIYNLTSHPTLTASIRPVTRSDQSSDIAQRVRETVGGDYSKWMSEDDIAAAGKDENVLPIARARLALAFNRSVSPKDRKRLLDTTEMLLNKGKPTSVAAPAS